MSDDGLLAAEFALGLLDEPESIIAERRVTRDPAFADAVDWWRTQFDTIDAAPVAPPPHLWRAIETRLPANDRANDDARAPTHWKWATLATSAVAATLLGVIVLRPTPAPVETRVTMGPGLREPPLVSSLTGKRGDVVNVTYDRDARTVLVSPTNLKPGVRDVELWIIPVGSAVPQSLGVIDSRVPQLRDVDPSRAGSIAVGATFAISLEPRGGSTRGAPTGPVVATGKIVRV